METEILYRPSYSVAKIKLMPNERLLAEPGAMVSMSAGFQIETGTRGGMLKSLARSIFGGESFFTNLYRAPQQGGELLLAPALPGDILPLELGEAAYLVQSGSFLASSTEIETDASWSGARTFFGGEGLIMLRCSGKGSLIISSYGAIHEVDLKPGQDITVDSGHLVAFPQQMNFRVRTIGGIKTTLLSGEGFVIDLQGPGKILLQTRSERSFLDWLIPLLPKQPSNR
ncbi:MAG TPA: TIGR00266 family protein [Anaerolineaceae bacterium]